MIMMMSMIVHDDDGDAGASDDDVPMFKVEPALYCCVLVVEPARPMHVSACAKMIMVMVALWGCIAWGTDDGHGDDTDGDCFWSELIYGSIYMLT